MRHTLQKLNIRLMALAMAIMVLVCSVPAVSAAEASGTCGENLSWSLSGDTLTITGSGAMYDFTELELAPWFDYRGSIARVELPAGLTRVGNLAFYQCAGVKYFSLPDSVTAIGDYAFASCTGMIMLDVSASLKTIGEGAFKDCARLPVIRLPGTLTAIGYQAFYGCGSLAEITVPASVTELGIAAFAFCGQMIRADIQAPLTVLPYWLFYGCERLTTLYLPATLTGADEYAFYDCTSLSDLKYEGSQEDLEQIRSDIQRDQEEEDFNVSVNDEDSQDNEHASMEETEDGIIVSSGTTTQTENGSVSTEVTDNYPGGDTQGESTGEVTVTLENSDGWEDVAETVEDVVEHADHTNLQICLKQDATLPEALMELVAGKNVTLTVQTADGSVWRIECSQLEAGAVSAADLSYRRMDATAEQLEKMGCTEGFQIQFLNDARINAEVMLKLPAEYARRTATLYQDLNGLQELQSVMVDNEGYAHFYLGSVEADIVYLIGIDVSGVDSAAVILPPELFALMGITDSVNEVEYVVTGRSSSWGMDINQVTVILIASMASIVVIVGVVMFLLNRRKLKMGYVPDLDDDEE